jgi:hypothetical protein
MAEVKKEEVKLQENGLPDTKDFHPAKKYKLRQPFGWGSGVVDEDYPGLDELGDWMKEPEKFGVEDENLIARCKKIFKENFVQKK